MPFIRLSDNYIDHPKIEPLSDGAFRLWHEMLAYSRRHQTDGLVPRTTLLGLKSYKSKRLDELMSDTRNGLPIIPLIAKVDGFGFKLHDYLQWNPSKDEENDRRAEAKARMRDTRERRKEVGDVPVFARTNCERSPTLSVRTSQDVLDTDRKSVGSFPERGFRGKPGGVMAGMLPRDHLNHAECGRVCLHKTQFQRFVAKFGGESVAAEAAISTWARGVLDEWNRPPKSEQPIGGNDFQFWDARWDEWHGPAAKADGGDDAMWAAIAAKGPKR
jgi:hypothetical protein